MSYLNTNTVLKDYELDNNNLKLNNLRRDPLEAISPFRNLNYKKGHGNPSSISPPPTKRTNRKETTTHNTKNHRQNPMYF